MGFHAGAIEKLVRSLGRDEALHYYALAKKQQTLENQWKRKAQQFLDSLTDKVLDGLLEVGVVPQVDFAPFFTEHAIAVAKEAFKSAEQSPKSSKVPRMARPTAKTVPRSLKDLMKMWDEFRKNGKIPPRQKEIAERVKKQYLKKVQKFWDSYGEQFRAGQEFDRERAKHAIQQYAKVSYARANMIVETETTYYYNQVRRKTYDQSPDVTHYLYMAIRDHATTKWCRTRDGMVMEKGTDFTDHNTPPVHWNCRSEVIPLVPGLNPRHAQLVNDRTRQPQNRSLAPLPEGWGKR